MKNDRISSLKNLFEAEEKKKKAPVISDWDDDDPGEGLSEDELFEDDDVNEAVTDSQMSEEDLKIESLKIATNIAKLMSDVTTEDIIEIADKVSGFIRNHEIGEEGGSEEESSEETLDFELPSETEESSSEEESNESEESQE